MKGAFDHVSRGKLLQRMKELRIDNDLIGWTHSFLRENELRSLGLAQKIEIGIHSNSVLDLYQRQRIV